jgi:hypothetical protein
MPTIKLRDKSNPNTILNTGLDPKQSRYCQHCHVKLVYNQDKIYTCPTCNCSVNIYNTEPQERLVTTFPTTSSIAGGGRNSKHIYQANKERLSRAEYFIQKTIAEKNKTEIEDPYLAILKKNNKITITNVDYFNPAEEE